VELVVSASKSMVQKSREEILELATRELAEFFPAAKRGQSCEGGGDQGNLRHIFNPSPAWTSTGRRHRQGGRAFFLAGDWTATGLARNHGRRGEKRFIWPRKPLRRRRTSRRKFIVPDLPATGLMKLL